MMQQSIRKNGLMLFAFALMMAAVLAFTHEGTKEKIDESERKAAKKALLEIIPQSRIDNDILTDTIELPEEARKQLGIDDSNNTVYIARKNNQVVAVIIPATAPDGYSGDIKLLAGINTDGTIAGVRVLAHKETPGLGDKIDLRKNNWITSFNGRSLDNPASNGWQVKKDGGEFDQFTGATITPRAVVRRVHSILKVVDDNQTLLFKTSSK